MGSISRGLSRGTFINHPNFLKSLCRQKSPEENKRVGDLTHKFHGQERR